MYEESESVADRKVKSSNSKSVFTDYCLGKKSNTVFFMLSSNLKSIVPFSERKGYTAIDSLKSLSACLPYPIRKQYILYSLY